MQAAMQCATFNRHIDGGISMAKTILITWRNMLSDPGLAGAVPRMAAEEPVVGGDAAPQADPVDPVVPAVPPVPAAPVRLKPLSGFEPRMAQKHRDNGFEIVFFDSAADHPGVSLANHLRSK